MWKRVLPRAASWCILFVLLQSAAPRFVEVERESLQKSEKKFFNFTKNLVLSDEGVSLPVVEGNGRIYHLNGLKQNFSAAPIDKTRLDLSLFDPLPKCLVNASGLRQINRVEGCVDQLENLPERGAFRRSKSKSAPSASNKSDW
jgi:hypothetical protein